MNLPLGWLFFLGIKRNEGSGDDVAAASNHPEGNIKSISHGCHPILVGVDYRHHQFAPRLPQSQCLSTGCFSSASSAMRGQATTLRHPANPTPNTRYSMHDTQHPLHKTPNPIPNTQHPIPDTQYPIQPCTRTRTRIRTQTRTQNRTRNLARTMAYQ